MEIRNKDIKNILKKYKELSLLTKINAVLDWDTNVNLPAKGADTRGKQNALITDYMTRFWLDPRIKDIIEHLSENGLNTEELAILRNLKHAGAYYLKVPKALILEKVEATTNAFMIWQKAKQEDSFQDFLPYLQKNVELDRQITEHLGYESNPYDALLNLYEPQLTANFLETIFTPLRVKLTNLLSEIVSSKNYEQKSSVINDSETYDITNQEKLCKYVLALMDYSQDEGRLDISAHPFTNSLGRYDVRITTHYHDHDFRPALSSTIHEAGHGLYELGVNPVYDLTPLEGGVSMAIHESQSRFWENQIGRNPVFLEFLLPHIKEAFPEKIFELNELVRAMNEVKPSLIRTEADEVTYNLHIMLRFEIENDLINKKIEVKDLPEIWRTKMNDYLGVTPSNDREGVLQDVHWSYGSFGYFPTYALGNLYAAQFAAQMKKTIKVDDILQSGNVQPVLDWLRKNIHTYGSLKWPKELVKDVTGEELNPKYFLDYIIKKYAKIYSF